VMSEFIRRRYADDQGMVSCFSCGRVGHWKAMQCGHFISRVRLATRWDEINCQVQDGVCNVLRRGNMPEFALALQRKYGPQILQELVDKSHQALKLTRADLLSKIEDYQTKLLTLKE